MREHINLVARLFEGEVIQFPGNSRTAPAMPAAVLQTFSPEDTFDLTITSTNNDKASMRRKRSVVKTEQGIDLQTVLASLADYKALTSDKERPYWVSDVTTTPEGRRRFELHIRLPDEEDLSPEQHRAINRMIANGYQLPLGWRQSA